jgi:hypothetical protein
MGITLKQLIDHYRTDPDSSFSKLRYQVRVRQERLLARIDREHGGHDVQSIRPRTLVAWHRQWESGGKVAMARSLFDRLRGLFKFGATILEDQECNRLCGTLEKMRLQRPTGRSAQMTLGHVRAICSTAREHFGWDSIALAQAFLFDLRLSQKDIIGEWVPVREPGKSDVVSDGKKWLRGLRWEHIGDNLVLRHTVGSGGRPIEFDLRNAPTVITELNHLGVALDHPGVRTWPTNGPLIVCETTGLPWSTSEFRRKWAKIAQAAGIPSGIENRDSFRHGADTEMAA